MKVVLPEELTIFNVEDFKKKLTNKLGETQNIELDCSKLQVIDGAGIQLLLSLKKTELSGNIELSMLNLSNEAGIVFAMSGVKELLES